MKTQKLLVVVEGHPGGSWYGEFAGIDMHPNGREMYRVGCADGTYNLVHESEVAKIVVACPTCGELPMKCDGRTIMLSGPCEGHESLIQGMSSVESGSLDAR